jgi:hypothetical protein
VRIVGGNGGFGVNPGRYGNLPQPVWRELRAHQQAFGMTASRERFSIRRIIVVTQIALSLVLLVAALLFVRSFRNLMTFDPGMRQAGITFGFLRLPLTALRHE